MSSTGRRRWPTRAPPCGATSARSWPSGCGARRSPGPTPSSASWRRARRAPMPGASSCSCSARSPSSQLAFSALVLVPTRPSSARRSILSFVFVARDGHSRVALRSAGRPFPPESYGLDLPRGLGACAFQALAWTIAGAGSPLAPQVGRRALGARRWPGGPCSTRGALRRRSVRLGALRGLAMLLYGVHAPRAGVRGPGRVPGLAPALPARAAGPRRLEGHRDRPTCSSRRRTCSSGSGSSPPRSCRASSGDGCSRGSAR